MKRITQVLTMILVVAALFAGSWAYANGTPPAPTNGVPFSCTGGNWNSVKFNMPGGGNLRTGTSTINGDTKKTALAYKPNELGYVWEFTQVGQGQCKATTVQRFRRLEIVSFERCEGVLREQDCYYRH